jgi:hypothetical protein
MPGSPCLSLRTDATQSRPYLRAKTTQRGTGDRMIGWDAHFRSRVSAIRSQVRVIRFRYGFRNSALCHPSSIQPSMQSSILPNRYPLPPIILEQTRDGLAAVGDRHGAATGHEVLGSVDLHRREDRGVEIGHAHRILDDGLG